MSLPSLLRFERVDHERLMDMSERIAPVRTATFGILALAYVSCVPWLGALPLVMLALAVVLPRIVEVVLARLPHLGAVVFVGWACGQLLVAGSIIVAHGDRFSIMPLFALSIVTLSARFSLQGMVYGVMTSLVLMVGAAFAADASAVVQDPPALIIPCATVIAIALLGTALMRSDVHHRSDAVIDQLTGMLNRKALSRRADELEQQSRLTRQPIALIVADVDHFKRVNDAHGHATGDAVLRDVAYLLRKQLRAFDLAFRLGGEEFIVVVPGADATDANLIADGLRRSVADATVGGGLAITMSFGVSATAPGEPFDYDAVFAQADGALYEAKTGGRNRVCTFDQHLRPVLG